MWIDTDQISKAAMMIQMEKDSESESLYPMA